MGPDAQVIAMSPAAIQVCVPAHWSERDIVRFVHSQCRVRIDVEFRRNGDPRLAGDSERRNCRDRGGYVHMVLDYRYV